MHVVDHYYHITSFDHYYDSIHCAGWWQCPLWLTSQEQYFSTTSPSIQLPTDLSRSILSTNLSLCVRQKKLEVLLLIIPGIQPVKACKYSLHKRTSKVRAQKETVRYQRLVRIGFLWEIFPLSSFFPSNNEKKKKEKKGRVVARESFIRREKEADSNVTTNCIHPGIKKLKAQKFQKKVFPKVSWQWLHIDTFYANMHVNAKFRSRRCKNWANSSQEWLVVRRSSQFDLCKLVQFIWSNLAK